MSARVWPKTWIDHDLNIKPYLWKHRALSWAQKFLSLGVLLAAFVCLHLKEWQVKTESIFPAYPFLQWLIFFAGIGVVSECISIPFGLAKHRVERGYQLSKQSYASWFSDRVKGWILGAILGTITLFILYFCIDHFPKNWWAFACTLFVLLSIVLAQLTPVLLIPIFFKLKPMDPGLLKDRLLALCEKFKIHVKDVYHLGLGEKTEKGNAGFVGLGGTKRIIIGDTLYQKFSPEEVEAVFAHELGHQVHSDLWKGIILSSGLMFLAFFVADGVWSSLVYDRPVRGIDLLVFFIILTIVQIPLGILQVLFSRYCERAADRFANETIGMGPKLADALEKLTFQNRGQFKPNAVWEFLTYSHPAPWRRILPLKK